MPTCHISVFPGSAQSLGEHLWGAALCWVPLTQEDSDRTRTLTLASKGPGRGVRAGEEQRAGSTAGEEGLGAGSSPGS